MYAAVARSLTGGEQGEEFGVGARAIEQLLVADNIHFIKFARPQDINYYRKREEFDKARRLI